MFAFCFCGIDGHGNDEFDWRSAFSFLFELFFVLVFDCWKWKIPAVFFSLSSHGKFMLSMEMGLDIVVAPEFSIHPLPCLPACLPALPMLDVKDFNPLEKLLEDCNCAFFSTRMVLVYILLFLDIIFFV